MTQNTNELSSWHACTRTHATDAHTSTPRAPRLHVAACGRETPWYLLHWPLAFNHCILQSVPPPILTDSQIKVFLCKVGANSYSYSCTVSSLHSYRSVNTDDSTQLSAM